MRVLVGFSVLLLVVACQPPPPEATEAEIAQMEAAVREEITSLADSVNDGFLTGDAEAVTSVYASDARIYWPGMNFTRDELQDWLVEDLQTTTWTEVEFKLVELFAHEDAVYVIYQWSGTFQVEEQEPESVIWNCFARFEKEDGVWKDDREVCGPRDAPQEG